MGREVKRGEKWKGKRREGKGKRRKRQGKWMTIGREEIKLKNRRVGKEIKLVATLYTPV